MIIKRRQKINARDVLYTGKNYTENNILDIVDKIYEKQKEVCFDTIYPVGTVYITLSNVNPGTLFGGTWEKIEGKFLLSADESHEVGSIGGEETHVLTANEMPSHAHTFTGIASQTTAYNNANHTHSIPALSGSTSSDGDHAHQNGYNWNKKANTNIQVTSGGVVVEVDWGDSIWTTTNGAHTHTLTTTASTTGANNVGHIHEFMPYGTVGTTGGSTAHNNMPPYITVYMWKRIK